tara:strand:+ start:588 stop:1598 length:1011 start_codon:yes stop_codon:yes gene_type:complete
VIKMSEDSFYPMELVEERIKELMEEMKIVYMPSPSNILAFDETLYYSITHMYGGVDIVAGYLGIIYTSGAYHNPQFDSIFLLCKSCHSIHRVKKRLYDKIKRLRVDFPLICQSMPQLSSFEGVNSFVRDSFNTNREQCTCNEFYFIGDDSEIIEGLENMEFSKNDHFLTHKIKNGVEEYALNKMHPFKTDVIFDIQSFCNDLKFIKIIDFTCGHLMFLIVDNVLAWFSPAENGDIILNLGVLKQSETFFSNNVNVYDFQIRHVTQYFFKEIKYHENFLIPYHNIFNKTYQEDGFVSNEQLTEIVLTNYIKDQLEKLIFIKLKLHKGNTYLQKGEAK